LWNIKAAKDAEVKAAEEAEAAIPKITVEDRNGNKEN
jgi:hypothetical protein